MHDAAGNDGRSGVRFKTRFDVMGFGSRANDAKPDRLVVFELQIDDALDNRLTHGQAVLCFTLLNDAQAGCRIVRFE